MSLNGFITAEAGFRCKSGKFSSIFDSKADIRIDNLKDFYPELQIVNNALELLKINKFIIISVGKFSATIMGTPDQFSLYFDVEVKKPQKEGDDYEIVGLERPGIITLGEKNLYAKVFGEVALSQPGHKLGCPKPADDWRLCPEDIPQKLSTTETIQATERGDGIHIAVIDSGFEKGHPFWKETNLNLRNIRIREEYIQDTLWKVQGIYEAWDREIRETKEELLQLRKKRAEDGLSNIELQRLEYLEALPNRFDQNEVVKFDAEFKRFVGENDPTGHGTAVMANLLSIVPEAKIDILKDFQGTPDLTFFLAALRAAVALKPNIITASIGFPIPVQTVTALAPLFNGIKAEIAVATKNGITVILPSGNKQESAQELIEIQGQWKEAIIVGGAYFDEYDALKLSELGHGYPDDYKQVPGLKAVPDNYGLSGPYKRGYIYVPKSSKQDEWEASNGTSLATPQVAGLCAILKQKFAPVSLAQMKEILIRSATTVPAGSTAQNIAPNQIIHAFDNDQISPGLVNISKALFVTDYFSAFQVAGDNQTIKRAAEIADNLGV